MMSGDNPLNSKFPLSKPSSNPNPKPTSAPPPSYGFHMLDRRSIVLYDGTARSYFALPPACTPCHFPPMSPDTTDPYFRDREGFNAIGKRKFGDDREFDRQRHNLLQFGKMGCDPNGDFSTESRNTIEVGGLDRQRQHLLQFGNMGSDPNSDFSTDSRKHRELSGNERELDRQRQHLLQFGNMGSDPHWYPGGDFPTGSRNSRDMAGLGEDEGELDRKRRHLLQFGDAGNEPKGYSGGEFSAGPSNPREIVDDFRMVKQMRLDGGYQGLQGDKGINKHNEVDRSALKKAFLHYVKSINENASGIKFYLENGKQGTLHCVVCRRSARNFPDMHALIMHTYNPDKVDKLVDHLGFHRALCVVMGWNYSITPDNSKSYQSLSADEATANKDDVILWPPMVIVHNTITGKGKKGLMEGLGNKEMDEKLRELGFTSGKAKSVYGREGHTGVTLVKFFGDRSGLKEAVRLAEFLEREKHGRKSWAHVQSSSTMGKDDENNPNLMELDKKTGEKQRIFYGYLGTVFDLDKVDFDTRKKTSIETKRDIV